MFTVMQPIRYKIKLQKQQITTAWKVWIFSGVHAFMRTTVTGTPSKEALI